MRAPAHIFTEKIYVMKYNDLLVSVYSRSSYSTLVSLVEHNPDPFAGIEERHIQRFSSTALFFNKKKSFYSHLLPPCGRVFY